MPLGKQDSMSMPRKNIAGSVISKSCSMVEQQQFQNLKRLLDLHAPWKMEEEEWKKQKAQEKLSSWKMGSKKTGTSFLAFYSPSNL